MTTSRAVPAPPPSTAGGVRLRPWRPDDAEWYVGARDDEVFRWTREDRSLTVAACRAAIEASAGRPAGFAIEDAEGSLLGSLGIRVDGRRVELSYWIAAPARGRGVATDALAAGADWAARLPGVAEVFLVTHPENAASGRVARKAGFVAAGTTEAPHACDTPDGLVDRYVRRGAG